MIWHEKGERRSIAYHVEVLKEAVSNGCSLAFRVGGGSSLVLLCKPRACGVPEQWSSEDLCGVLAQAGCLTREVVAPGKQPSFIRATPPESVSGAFGAVKVGDSVIMLQRAVQRKPKEASVN